METTGKIEAIAVRQNKQDFLIGVYSIQEILKFTKYTRRLIVSYDEDGEPIYNEQIQRNIENPRVQKIADFLINDPDATFPTNIVLHIPIEVIDEYLVDEKNRVSITLNPKVFSELKKEDGNIFISIIDGQHRVKGIEIAIQRLRNEIDFLIKNLRINMSNSLENKLMFFQDRLNDLLNIQLVVTFFIDKTLEYQAMIFSTINRTQKRVSQSLVYSLFGLDTDDTPQKTALEIVLRLNGHKKSPFYKRIKLYGASYSKNDTPPLSQATMVKSIVNLISENLRESENDRYKKRKELLNRNSSSNRFLPFRKYYASDRDSLISDIMFFYFYEIKNIFEGLWDFEGNNMPTNILHTTIGYESLLKILVDILKEEKNIEQLNYEISKTIFRDKYLKYIQDIDISNVNRYSFNQRGKKYFYLDMSLKIFPPEDLADLRLKELRTLE
ncbi:DGQHR domain-containing protein [Chryseobacterium pennae]|nr:DGQHR domain-containing protein [Chryseobacterium pennae]